MRGAPHPSLVVTGCRSGKNLSFCCFVLLRVRRPMSVLMNRRPLRLLKEKRMQLDPPLLRRSLPSGAYSQECTSRNQNMLPQLDWHRQHRVRRTTHLEKSYQCQGCEKDTDQQQGESDEASFDEGLDILVLCMEMRDVTQIPCLKSLINIAIGSEASAGAPKVRHGLQGIQPIWKST